MSRRGRNFRKADHMARDARSIAHSSAVGSTRREPSKAELRERGRKAYDEWQRRQAARPEDAR